MFAMIISAIFIAYRKMITISTHIFSRLAFLLYLVIFLDYHQCRVDVIVRQLNLAAHQ